MNTQTLTKRQLYRYDGGLIYVDATNSEQQRLQSFGYYEPKKTEFLKKWWQPQQVFIDIGASCGYFTFLAAKYLNRGYVHAIEPEMENVAWLERAIQMNDYQHIRLHPVAASDTDGYAILHVAEEHGQHSLYRLHKKMERFEVETRMMDHLIRDHRADCIKVDVEGMELRVLRGAERILRRSPRIAVVMDLHPEYHDDNPAIGDYLKRLGFRLFDPRNDMEPVSVVAYNCHELIAIKES